MYARWLQTGRLERDKWMPCIWAARKIIPDTINELFDARLPGKHAKAIAKQALLGLDILHQHKIGHGSRSFLCLFFFFLGIVHQRFSPKLDLHMDNLAFTIPWYGSHDRRRLHWNARKSRYWTCPKKICKGSRSWNAGVYCQASLIDRTFSVLIESDQGRWLWRIVFAHKYPFRQLRLCSETA